MVFIIKTNEATYAAPYSGLWSDYADNVARRKAQHAPLIKYPDARLSRMPTPRALNQRCDHDESGPARLPVWLATGVLVGRGLIRFEGDGERVQRRLPGTPTM